VQELIEFSIMLHLFLFHVICGFLPLGALSFSTKLPALTSLNHRGKVRLSSDASYVDVDIVEEVSEDKRRTNIATALSDEDHKVLNSIDMEILRVMKSNEKKMKELLKVESRIEDLENRKGQYVENLSLSNPYVENFHETSLRSVAKALSWRLIGGSITFLSSLSFSGSLSTAFSMVGSDFFSKVATMFIGERLMDKSQFGRNSGADDMSRSLVKALLWRLFAVSNTLVFAVFFAEDIKIACKIASFDSIFKTALMFFFERTWSSIEWGKEYEDFSMSSKAYA